MEQAVQFEAPCFSDTRPASRAVHDKLPLVLANVPLVHFSHLLRPVALWNWPVWQAEHCVAAGCSPSSSKSLRGVRITITGT